jgi:Uma2 family endonuclease
MATAASIGPATQPPPPALLPLRRITVDEYERIVAANALDDLSRIELIDGYMVTKMGKSAEHSFATKETLKALDRRIPPGWTSRKEEPLRIPAYDEPEPDIAIVRGSDADYRHMIPQAVDVSLVIEVSGPTLKRDRGEKRLAYAKGRIPVYWIINLVKEQVEVYSNPEQGRYLKTRIYKRGRRIPVTVDGQRLDPIAVDDILP